MKQNTIKKTALVALISMTGLIMTGCAESGFGACQKDTQTVDIQRPDGTIEHRTTEAPDAEGACVTQSALLGTAALAAVATGIIAVAK